MRTQGEVNKYGIVEDILKFFGSGKHPNSSQGIELDANANTWAIAHNTANAIEAQHPEIDGDKAIGPALVEFLANIKDVLHYSETARRISISQHVGKFMQEIRK